MRVCPACLTRFEEGIARCPQHPGEALLTVVPGDPLCGTLVADRFLVLQRVGSGAMGVVYRALQVAVRRAVALKVMAPATDGDRVDREKATARFSREARAMAALRSPHTVTVHDFGSLPDGGHYIAMELLTGRSLLQLMRSEGRVEPARLVPLLTHICLSLEEAHARGLVHRDLKPGNVMVETREDGTEYAKVLDFGLVKSLLSESAELTEEGTSLGTPAYMAPEQVRGDEVDPRSDLYSLGALAFSAAAGRNVFTANSAYSMMMKHVTQPAPHLPDDLLGDPACRALDAVIQRCMAKDPERRYPAARDVREALAAVPVPAVAFARPVAPVALVRPAAPVEAALADSGSPAAMALAVADTMAASALRSRRFRLPIAAAAAAAVALLALGVAFWPGRNDGPAATAVGQPDAGPPAAGRAESARQPVARPAGGGLAAPPSAPGFVAASAPEPADASAARAAGDAEAGADGAGSDAIAAPDVQGDAADVSPDVGASRKGPGRRADRPARPKRSPDGAGDPSRKPAPEPTRAEDEPGGAAIRGVQALGLPAADARTALNGARAALLRCHAKHGAGAKYHVTVALDLDHRVKSVSFRPALAASDPFRACAEPVLRGLSFPAARGMSFGSVRFSIGP